MLLSQHYVLRRRTYTFNKDKTETACRRRRPQKPRVTPGILKPVKRRLLKSKQFEQEGAEMDSRVNMKV